MAGRIEGKVAIVTGAASGIGNAMARLFAAEGARVVVADLKGAEEAAAAIGHGSLAVAVDVSDEAQVKAMIARTVEVFGRLDILCNNAGRSGGVNAIVDTPMELFDAVHAINLRGAFMVIQHAIAQMLKNGGGAIVNTASIAAHIGSPGTVSYSAAKAGIMGMTRVAAVEYASRNIRVNAICPGVIATPMVAAALTQEQRDNMEALIPMKRLGTPEEMAKVALFLASDDASYVTGIGVNADGGRCVA